VRIVFVEASLETIPEEILHHAQVISSSRVRGKSPESMLLEDNLHYIAIKKLKMYRKRGRPDIVHRCLLLCLDSNVDNLFSEIFVHTVTGKVIQLYPEVRLPRTYERFRGLMEKLFLEGVVKDRNGKILIKVLNCNLDDILQGKVAVLREKGRNGCDSIKKADTICVGAFPHGDFEKSTLKIFSRKKAKFVSFSKKSYTALYALCRTICCLLEDRPLVNR